MDKMSRNSMNSEKGLTGHSNSRLSSQGRVTFQKILLSALTESRL